MRFVSWSFAALFALSPLSFAQTAPEPVPLQTTSGTGFSGAPYLGKQTTVKKQTLTDGTIATEMFVEYLWRDSQGRTRREMVQHTKSGEEYRSVVVTDPVDGMYLKWTAGLPSARKVMNIWPVTSAQRVTAPVPGNQGQPEKQGSATTTPGLQKEVLPPQEINGVYAEGTRTTRTVQLTEESSKRILQVTNELWISPELRVIVRHVREDPRTGMTVTDVTDIARGDPDPALFQAPAGYAVVDHREQNRQ
jgi:hypothetical protein